MENRKKTNYLMILLVVLLVTFVFSSLLFPNSQFSCDFKGDAREFEIQSSYSWVQLESDFFVAKANKANLSNVDDIYIKYKTGKEENIKPQSDTSIKIQAGEYLAINEYSFDKPICIVVNDAKLEKRQDGSFKITGKFSNLSEPLEMSSDIYIFDGLRYHVFINNEEIIEYDTIIIKSNDHILYTPEQIELELHGISNADISGIMSEINFHGSEGILRLNDRMYDIQNPENIDIAFDFVGSKYKIHNSSIEFLGSPKTLTKNEKDLMTNKLMYWFYEKTERINALATLILVTITAYYAYLNRKMVTQNDLTRNQTEKIIDQNRINRKIDYTEKRLENFYYPLIAYFGGGGVFGCDGNAPHKIFNFNYLASKHVRDLFLDYLEQATSCKETKELEQELFRNLKIDAEKLENQLYELIYHKKL